MRTDATAYARWTSMLLLALFLAAGLTAGLPAGRAFAADDGAAAVARALATQPVVVSTSPGTPAVDMAAVRAALPPDTVVAVLPAAAAGGAGGIDLLAPEISSRLGRGGTVIVLAGRQLGAASTTVSGQLPDDLLTARGVLSGRPGDPAAAGLAIQTLERSVGSAAGGPIAPDASTAPRAGSPGSASGLYALLAIVVLAVAGVGLRLLRRRRRASRPAPPPAAPVKRTRIEVDAYGQIIRRVRPDEQE